jgi:nucleoside-diphosphate-sugar epimerase
MWRPLMWVGEPSRVFHSVLQSEESKIKSQVFNLGANGENFQKIKIAKLIKENFIPELKIDIIDKDPDLRSYKVNFNKISKVLDYKPSKKIVEAMGEIFSSLKKNLYSDTNSQKYRN